MGTDPSGMMADKWADVPFRAGGTIREVGAMIYAKVWGFSIDWQFFNDGFQYGTTSDGFSLTGGQNSNISNFDLYRLGALPLGLREGLAAYDAFVASMRIASALDNAKDAFYNGKSSGVKNDALYDVYKTIGFYSREFAHQYAMATSVASLDSSKVYFSAINQPGVLGVTSVGSISGRLVTVVFDFSKITNLGGINDLGVAGLWVATLTHEFAHVANPFGTLDHNFTMATPYSYSYVVGAIAGSQIQPWSLGRIFR